MPRHILVEIVVVVVVGVGVVVVVVGVGVCDVCDVVVDGSVGDDDYETLVVSRH